MNPSQQHLPKLCPKRLFFFFTPVLFFSLYYIFTTVKTITISSQDPHHPPQLQVPSISHYASLPETSKNQSPSPLLLPPTPPSTSLSSSSYFPLCPKNFTNYLPCHDPSTARQYSIERHYRRERHCPDIAQEKFRCLVPKPTGYKTPFPWPESRKYAWFKNVPFKRLAELKKTQNWVRLEGDRFVFPGGGTSFPSGVKDYVDVILSVLPLASGSIRTVLDIGCGVASFGAFLLNYNILTMSIAPRDIHEAQVQFALERGLPAMLGVLSTYKLPYPSRSFDMVHCSRCLVNWTAYDGLYLMEVDRVLRPDGYWVLSGPPVASRVKSKNQKRDSKELQNQMEQLNDVFRRLCWEKIAESYPVVIWRKPFNILQCRQRLKFPGFCSSSDPDAAWYKEMEPCITPLPDVNDTHKTVLRNWPERLNHAPRLIKTGSIQGKTIASFKADTNLWQRRVLYYDTKLKFLSNGKYRNIIDMNAGLGGFAAALNKYPIWVMNVVPFDLKPNTLGVVYDRGLIGTYMNWCEAFSTYSRTYDLIHANGVFSLYLDKCDIVDILLEMQRILRPEGAVIIRDRLDVLIKVKAITNQMRWNGTIYPEENSGFDHGTILIVDNSVK
ncbi:S-adenosyl-L-methionine-dependent methyltransferase [Arabidopsis thaliana x Arabidopsis arenosa]|uniref:Methyltransferase n=1 Tax=Arabidopsis thaliana x Arabidopsis arenosa TaxID=1240361 RepID=A0A8T2ADX3_9BRAS|nr:S-adenosyl-L-methionine-dependent methyltransferase [Arabidopsis thaliana x Arabidopsis arenosa]